MPLSVDALKKLPLLTWRGLSAPCETAPFDGAHEQAPRAYPYVNGEGHDHTGRRSYVAHARLHFGEGVEEGAFTYLWPRWRIALEDGSAGTLVHPVLGTFNARVLTWSGDLNAHNRGGIVVDVVWAESLVDPTRQDEFETPPFALDVLAEAAEAAAAEYGITWPTGRRETSLLDAIKQVQGALFSASLTLSGYVTQVMGVVTDMIDMAESLTDPTSWPAYDNLVHVWSQLSALQRKAESKFSGRSTRMRKIAVASTLDALSRETGTSVSDLLALNPGAAAGPVVPAGTTIVYFG